MFGAHGHYRFAGRVLLATACIVLVAHSATGQLRPNAASLAAAPPEVLDRLRASPFTYFRFINRAWIARVCEKFADASDVPIVRLHGDAHVEQFALTKDAWGLDDFDDSARGPEFVDIVRYLGSIDLATRQLGWTRDRNALWDRFLDGYRRGLSDPGYRAPEPDIVRRLRAEVPLTRSAFLAWGERQMQPMDEVRSKAVLAGMKAFERVIRGERPALPPGYFAVVRAGWLHIGVGSSVLRKVLIRVQGPTTAPDDDVLLEAKEAADLEGLSCLDGPMKPPAIRIIDGTRQLARLKHDILAVGPTLLIPTASDRREHWLEWWVTSWEPTYREIRLSDLRSSADLGDIAFDSGVQLGAGESQEPIRKQALSALTRLDSRLRQETSSLVEELLEGWREMGGK